MSKRSPIDLKLGIQLFQGDEDKYRKALETYSSDKNYKQAFRDLHTAILAMDFARIPLCACTMNGLAGYICANQCADLAHNICLAANKKNRDTVLSEYIKFLNHSMKLEVAISKITLSKPNISPYLKSIKDILEKYNVPDTQDPQDKVKMEDYEYGEQTCSNNCNAF